MLYALVNNTEVVGTPFTLPTNYVTADGRVILNVELLTEEEKLSENLFPVSETARPIVDSSYQELVPGYIVGASSVVVSYTVEDVPSLFKSKLESILTRFAAEKDIDIQEVSMLLRSSNLVWQAEALEFQALYDLTWQAFYNYTGSSWQELEAALPILRWV